MAKQFGIGWLLGVAMIGGCTGTVDDPALRLVDAPPLGACEESSLVAEFERTVFVRIDECAACHGTGELSAVAPKWVGLGGDASRETMFNVVAGGYVDMDSPGSSLLVLKPLAERAGGMEHGGGDVFASRSEPAYLEFMDFIDAYIECYGDGNVPPIADPGPDRSMLQPSPGALATVDLDASQSVDPDGRIVDYAWSWGGPSAGSARGVSPTVSLGVGTHVISLTVTDDGGLSATASQTIVIEPFPSDCSGTDALSIYTRRIEPLVSGNQPQSCSQCHLSNTSLSTYVQDTPCQTMACLVDQGEVDLANPRESLILGRILNATPESTLITDDVIQAEYDGFLEWITYSATCQDSLCGQIEDPCNSGTGAGPTPGVATPLGSCDEDAITDAFANLVFSWRGRCESCHTESGPGRCNPEWGDTCAPSFIAEGDPALIAANTMYNLIGRGAIDVERPAASLFITKPLRESEGGVMHLGGDKIASRSEQTYADFLQFAQYYASCYTTGVQPPIEGGINVLIANPRDGGTVDRNNVYLQGTARTAETELVGSALVWRSSLVSGPVATGTGSGRISLPTGTQTITLTATAPDGSVATDTITITSN